MRPIWKGSLSFGLVNIPVRMYSGSSQRELKFKLLHKKDLSEIRYARICKKEGKEIPWKEIVKGYEYEKGEYIPLTEEDFQKANFKKTQTVEILDFTEQDQVDPLYYDHPYYLEPEKSSVKAYHLLYEALKRAKKIGIGRFVLHHHEHIGAIRPHEKGLILQQLRYHSQIVDPKELKIPRAPVAKKELDVAIKLIEELSRPFDPMIYSDGYINEIKGIIKKKGKGQKILIPKESKSPKIQDMMTLLKESLKQKSQKKRKKRKAA